MRKIEGVHSSWYDAAVSGLDNLSTEESRALKFCMFLTSVLGAVAGYSLHALGV